MKKNIKILALAFASVFYTSCEKVVPLVDTDPNSFTSASSDLMINAPFLSNALVTEGELARITGMWSGYFTGADRQYLSLNKYITVSGDYDNIWGTLYADGIAQSRLIREDAVQRNNTELEGISMIVEANLALTAASLWGDIPYTEAGDVEKFPTPAYDKQKDVYSKVIALLDEAITKVGAAGGDSYGSETISEATRNNLLWSEVANSLKARAYLHQGDYANAYASAINGISSSNGDWLFEHNGGSYPNNISGSQNIYWDFCVWNRDGYMGAGDAHLVQIMNTNNDPRLYHYYHPPGWWNNDWYPAVWPNGEPGGPKFDAGSDFPIITYYENELILAECELLLNSDANSALTHLNNVRSYWEGIIGVGTFPAKISSDFVDNAALLMEILTEKYISTYGQIEVFNDIRRTDNYIGVPIKAGAVGTKIPERLLYPQSELNANPNVPDETDVFKSLDIFNVKYLGSSI